LIPSIRANTSAPDSAVLGAGQLGTLERPNLDL
jgi:hypothetical protein